MYSAPKVKPTFASLMLKFWAKRHATPRKNKGEPTLTHFTADKLHTTHRPTHFFCVHFTHTRGVICTPSLKPTIHSKHRII
jgi:hypothetical protein